MRAKSRLRIPECRGLLAADTESSLTDEQIVRLRDQFYELASVALAAYRTQSAPSTSITGLADSDRMDLEERAAIIQFEGNFTREQSERLALDAQLQSKSRH